MRQNSPDSLVVLQNLTAKLSQATQPNTQLRPLLNEFVQIIRGHWPGLAHINIYLAQPEGLFERFAGIDVSLDAALDPAPAQLVSQVIADPTPRLPETTTQPAQWVIPLLSGQEVIGIIEATLSVDAPIPPVLEPVLLALAVPLALVIERLKTRPSGASSLSVLGTLHAISQQLGTYSAKPDMLHSISKSLIDALELDYIAVLRFDTMLGTASVMVEHPVHLGQNKQFTLQEFGVYQHLQTHHTSLRIDDIHTSDHLGASRTQFQALNLHSILIAPLMVQDDLLGGLLVGVSDHARTLNEDDLRITQIIATEIALSLRSTEFFAEIQRRSNQLERISAFGRLVTGTLDQDQILRHVIEVVPNLLPADQVSVAFYSIEHNHMDLFELSDGINPHELRLTAAGSSVEDAVQKYNPLLINDLASSTYTDHQRLVQQGLQSAIVAPLTVSGRTLGTVSVANRHARTYTPTDLNLLLQISNQIAIALENAHIFSSAQRRAKYEEALSEITSHLQEQSDLRMILQQTLQDFGTILGASRARVRLQVTPSELDISKLFQPKE